MDNKYLVDIVILNLNQEADTAECILSLKRMYYKNYRVILVDNGSTDGSGFRIKERFRDVQFLRSEENLGFAGGCNMGIRYSLENSRANYILLLNNDAVVSESLLTALLETVQPDRAIGIAGAVNYYYFWPDKVHMAAHRFFWWLGMQGILTAIEGKSKEVQSVSGCCMMIKKEVRRRQGCLMSAFLYITKTRTYV